MIILSKCPEVLLHVYVMFVSILHTLNKESTSSDDVKLKYASKFVYLCICTLTRD